MYYLWKIFWKYIQVCNRKTSSRRFSWFTGIIIGKLDRSIRLNCWLVSIKLLLEFLSSNTANNHNNGHLNEKNSQNNDNDTSGIFFFVMNENNLLIINLLNYSMHSSLDEIITLLSLLLVDELLHVFFADWIWHSNYVPEYRIWAWWSGQRTLICPSVVSVYHLEESSNLNLFDIWVFINDIPLQWIKEFVDDFQFPVIKFCSYFFRIIEENTKNSVFISVIIFDTFLSFVQWSVNNMKFKRVLLSSNGVLRVCMPMPLGGLPNMSSFSGFPCVPWLEHVDSLIFIFKIDNGWLTSPLDLLV